MKTPYMTPRGGPRCAPGRAWLFALGLAFSLACRSSHQPDPLEDEFLLLFSPRTATGGACNSTRAGSVTTARVNATSNDTFVYCDLATGSTTGGAPGTGWDLAFQRFRIATASGVSLAGGGGGACSPGTQNFEAVTAISQFSRCATFVVDTALQTTSGGAAGAASLTYNGNELFREWYSYDTTTHVLSAKADVLLVRSSDARNAYKVQMLDYYSTAGTPGYPTLRWAEIGL